MTLEDARHLHETRAWERIAKLEKDLAEAQEYIAELSERAIPNAAARAFTDAIGMLVTETKDNPAKNYVSFSMSWEPGMLDRFPFRDIEVILRRPGGKTTHQIAKDAEAERDALKATLREVRRIVIKSGVLPEIPDMIDTALGEVP